MPNKGTSKLASRPYDLFEISRSQKDTRGQSQIFFFCPSLQFFLATYYIAKNIPILKCQKMSLCLFSIDLKKKTYSQFSCIVYKIYFRSRLFTRSKINSAICCDPIGVVVVLVTVFSNDGVGEEYDANILVELS